MAIINKVLGPWRRLGLSAMVTILVILSVSSVPAHSAQRGIKVDSGQRNSAKRTALVIGNADYKGNRLRNPVNDANLMAGTLRGLGFEVISGFNLDLRGMKRAVKRFGERLDRGGVGLFYYAGHGLQVKGINYLIPIGAQIDSEFDVELEGLDVRRVLVEMREARNRLNLVFLDACRNNPYARSFRSSSSGLAQMDAPTGTLIAFATGPGSVAADGSGSHGIFTEELTKQMTKPGLMVESVLKRTRVAVTRRTGGKQVPWDSSSLTGDFYFKPGQASGKKPQQPIQLADSPGPKLGEIDQRKLKIQQLLKQAEADLSSNRLTSPKGNNAYEKYRQVLELNPTNSEANKGLKQIVGKYVDLAQGRIKARDFVKAEDYLIRAEKVSEGDHRVLAARDALVRASKRQAREGNEIPIANKTSKLSPDSNKRKVFRVISIRKTGDDLYSVEVAGGRKEGLVLGNYYEVIWGGQKVGVGTLVRLIYDSNTSIIKLKSALDGLDTFHIHLFRVVSSTSSHNKIQKHTGLKLIKNSTERSSDGRFTKNASGIITDSRTGLQWYVGPDRNTDWYKAKEWVEGLSATGGGWRMPSRSELRGLYEKSKGSRNMDPIFKTTGWYVWSYLTKGVDEAWGFGFFSGNESLTTQYSVRNSRAFAVRSRR